MQAKQELERDIVTLQEHNRKQHGQVELLEKELLQVAGVNTRSYFVYVHTAFLSSSILFRPCVRTELSHSLVVSSFVYCK